MNAQTCKNIAQTLNELYPSGLILGECKAVVSDLGLLVEWNIWDKEKGVKTTQKRFQPNEKLSITKINGEMLTLGDYVPNIIVHASRFKGFERRIEK